MSWRKIADTIKGLQGLKKEASFSFGSVKVAFPIADKPVRVAVISDWHAGSLGTNYDLWVKSTDYIKQNNILVLCVGDMLQMQFLRSWIEELGGAGTGGHLLASTWDNHSVMRTENQAGLNEYGRLFADVCPYFNSVTTPTPKGEGFLGNP